MNINFSKYQGAGNDFIMIDNRDRVFPKDNTKKIEHLCHRRFGIGADGLILLENSNEADFKMVYFNADGNESSMCGNGGRCIAAFAKQLGVIENQASFIAIDGLHQAEILNDGRVVLGMQDVAGIEKVKENEFILNTGSPHYVIVLDEMPENILQSAKMIRYGERFKENGINVNFITVNDKQVHIRTYERGVEDETLACGTGSVAAAMVAAQFTKALNYQVFTQGGELQVKFDKNLREVFLIGNAIFVFNGMITN